MITAIHGRSENGDLPMESADHVSQDMVPAAGSAKLVYRQQMTIVTQILLVVFALPCLLPLYRLIILTVDQLEDLTRPRGDIALVLLAIGAMTLAVALSKPSRTVTFDPLAREMVVLYAGAFGLHWQRRYSFCDLGW